MNTVIDKAVNWLGGKIGIGAKANPKNPGHEKGRMKIKVKCEAYSAPDANGNRQLTGVHEDDDLSTLQLAQLIQLNLLNNGGNSIKDTSNSSHTESANTSAGTIQIVAGTGTTAAAVTDHTLQTQSSSTSGYVTATINNPSGWSGTSGTFTVTGTITNSSGSTITYSEVGIYITVNSHIYMLCHDVFTGLAVSNSGTLAITYTWTFS